MRFPKIQTVSGQLRGAKVIWGILCKQSDLRVERQTKYEYGRKRNKETESVDRGYAS